jgi:hypothetical protein
MPRYAIAVPTSKQKVLQKIVEGEGQEDAMKKFFFENMADQYSNDDQGYFYFKEDNFDPKGPMGSILEV